MNSLLHDYATRILDNAEPPCLSLYQPTHRHHPDNQQDPIRFRNLLKAARAIAPGNLSDPRCAAISETSLRSWRRIASSGIAPSTASPCSPRRACSAFIICRARCASWWWSRTASTSSRSSALFNQPIAITCSASAGRRSIFLKEIGTHWMKWSWTPRCRASRAKGRAARRENFTFRPGLPRPALPGCITAKVPN